MTQPPAGWYPEPDPTYAGQPGRLRYWDGQRWTEHTHEPEPAPAPPAFDAPGPPAFGVPAPPAPAPYPSYGSYQQQYGASPYASAEPVTPDGVPLAGWGWRVLAKILDGFIALPLYALAAAPVVASQWDSLRHWFDDVSYNANHNLAAPPAPDLLTPFTRPWLALVGLSVAAYLVYELVFLFWKQATPGKLALGMRVRLRDSPELPASAILPRVGFFLLNNFCFLLAILDYLWPLWDPKKQALHDKVARTNVVKPAR